MRHRKPWWWWTALACMIGLTISATASIRWTIRWRNDRIGWYFDLDGAALRGDINWRLTPHDAGASWYGSVHVDRRQARRFAIRLLPMVRNRGSGDLVFELPLAVPALVAFIALAAPYTAPFLKRRRRKAGLCVACAYDLTGNESGTCPECGREI